MSALIGGRWVPGLPGLDKVARTVDSPTAMINYLRTLPADEVRPLEASGSMPVVRLAPRRHTYRMHDGKQLFSSHRGC